MKVWLMRIVEVVAFAWSPTGKTCGTQTEYAPPGATSRCAIHPRA